MPIKNYYVIVSTKEGVDHYYAEDKFFTTEFSKAFLMEGRLYANAIMRNCAKAISTISLRLQEVQITLKDIE